MENLRYVIKTPFLVVDLKPLHEDARHRMGGRELPKTPKGAAFMALKRNISRATQFSWPSSELLLAYWPKRMPIITWMSILTIRVAGGIASSRFLIVIGKIGAPRIFLWPICENMYLLGYFNLQKKYLNEGELTAHMNDNFETPCRQLFGQPWDIFMKTLTQLCNNFERGVYLCPALCCNLLACMT